MSVKLVVFCLSEISKEARFVMHSAFENSCFIKYLSCAKHCSTLQLPTVWCGWQASKCIQKGYMFWDKNMGYDGVTMERRSFQSGQSSLSSWIWVCIVSIKVGNISTIISSNIFCPLPTLFLLWFQPSLSHRSLRLCSFFSVSFLLFRLPNSYCFVFSSLILSSVLLLNPSTELFISFIFFQF